MEERWSLPARRPAAGFAAVRGVDKPLTVEKADWFGKRSKSPSGGTVGSWSTADVYVGEEIVNVVELRRR